MKTKVIFRKWHNGDVIALLPEVPADTNGIYCSSYEHTGQHGSADCHGCIMLTEPAKPAEYAALKAELTRIGYDLQPITRTPRNAYETRKAAARPAPVVTIHDPRFAPMPHYANLP